MNLFIRMKNGTFVNFVVNNKYVDVTAFWKDESGSLGDKDFQKRGKPKQYGYEDHPDYDEPQKWIYHIITVLNQPRIWKLYLGQVWRYVYSLDLVFIAIEKCDELKIVKPCRFALKERALEIYPRSAREVVVENFKLQKIHLIQNLDYLESNHIPDMNVTFQPTLDLDSLLTINSLYFTIVCPSLNILNKFLKLWSKKKTNPRLRHARFLKNHGQFKIQEILTGIPYQEAAGIRKFNYPKEEYEKDWEKCHRMILDFKEGFDFRRCDGTLGIVFWNKVFSRIDFFVWS